MAQSEKLGLKEAIAMGVGGMVGGGIFSVLGLSIMQAGHAAPLAFLFGGLVAIITGLSYIKLGLAFRDDGGSFTYLEQAFQNRHVAGIGGWVLLLGYIGTLSLYAFTFGVYGAKLFGETIHYDTAKHFLSSGVLLTFLAINLYGVRASGVTEDVIVLVKVIILGLFAVIGLIYFDPSHIDPFFDKGALGLLMGSALIFVAYEGFELIPNAINEMEDPERNLGLAIIGSIVITTTIYVLVALVATSNLSLETIQKYEEYALAQAAKPFLGQMGFVLIGMGALLSTASAINATLFGTARLGQKMAKDKALPKVFSLKEKTKNIPWVSLVVITVVTLVFVNVANLTIISAFASATFLLIFASINLSALRLRHQIGLRLLWPLFGLLLTVASLAVLLGYLYQTDQETLKSILALYAGVIVIEFLFSPRGCGFQRFYAKR